MNIYVKGMLLGLVTDCGRTILAIFGIVKLDSDRRSGGKNDAKQLSGKTPRNCQPKVPRGTRSLPTVTEWNSHFCWGWGAGGDKSEF